MSDGGEQSTRESEHHASLQRVHPDYYDRVVSKVAVAQICEGVGFDCLKQSAMEALSDVAIRYICDLGKSASLYASLSGRSETNVFDIVKGLEDLSSISGFSGASEVNRCVSSSGIVKEMAEFVVTLEEISFAQPIPRFPMIKSRRGIRIPSFLQTGEAPNDGHIPDWLPAFPDPHTYIHSPMWDERKTDPRTDKAEQVRQRRKAEKSLLSLQQRLISNGFTGPSGSGHNPFLAPPLPSGEKHVSLPAKLVTQEGETKRVSVVDTFGPAIDAMKGRVSDSMELDRRPVVHFKLKAGKKMLVEDLNVNLRNCSNGRKSSWVGREDDKDDKKRRAELILRQSIENPPELLQM